MEKLYIARGDSIDVFNVSSDEFEVSIKLGFATIDFIFTGPVLGDINGDGVVDLLDIQPFVDAITNGTFSEEADINGDGVVDLLDVAPFIDLLTCQ